MQWVEDIYQNTPQRHNKPTDTWNIGWNCLGGGIQYLLPTMIEPTNQKESMPPETSPEYLGKSRSF